MPVGTRYFEVTTPQGLSTLKLDSKGCTTVQITVKNVSRAPIDGRVILVSVPVTRPPKGAVENKWLTLEGPNEIHFNVDEEKVFSVKVAVPQKKDNPPAAGNYGFRLDMVNTADPDLSADQSPTLGFTVAPPPPQKPSMLPWIALAAGVVLIIGGVVAWLLTRGNPVPDLTGKTTDEAVPLLANVKLALNQDIDHAESTIENSGKILKQDPASGTKAKSGTLVKVTVGAQMVTMPTLIGRAFADAQATATRSSLGIVTSTVGANPAFASNGIVWDQTPSPGTTVKQGTPVAVKVTPQTIAVISVIGMTFTDARLALQRASLGGGPITGNNTLRVISQNPAPGAQVPIGTPVTLFFPACPFAWCGTIMQPAMAQQLLVDRLRVMTNPIQLR